MASLNVKYIKHSLRQVHEGCAECGTDKLYFAHEQVGPPDRDSKTWCYRCQASGTLVMVDMDTIKPHACTNSPPSGGTSGEGEDSEGKPENDEASQDEILAALADVLKKENAITEAIPALIEDIELPSMAGDAGDEPEEEPPLPFPEDDEFVTHNELNEFNPVSRPEVQEAFGNVRDGMNQIAESHVRQGGRLAQLSEQMIEFERRTRITIVINDAATGEEYELPDELHHQQLGDVIRFLSAEHTLMVGGAGAGKGEIAYQAAEALRIPFYTLDQGSLSPQTPVSSIIGYMNSSGKYVGTTFRQAFEHGGLIFLDELDNAHPACLATINAALAIRAGQELGWPGGKMVTRHENFRVLAAANTFGRGPDRTYGARQRGDAATWDRFAILHLKYDTTLEDVLCARTGIDQETRVKAVSYVRKLRENVEKHQGTIPVVIGMRASIGLCKLLKAGVDQKTAIEARCRRGMSDQDWGKISAGISFTPATPKPASNWSKPENFSDNSYLEWEVANRPKPPKPALPSSVSISGDLLFDAWYVVMDSPYQIQWKTEGGGIERLGIIITREHVNMIRGQSKIQLIKTLRQENYGKMGLVPAKALADQVERDLIRHNAASLKPFLKPSP